MEDLKKEELRLKQSFNILRKQHQERLSEYNKLTDDIKNIKKEKEELDRVRNESKGINTLNEKMKGELEIMSIDIDKKKTQLGEINNNINEGLKKKYNKIKISMEKKYKKEEETLKKQFIKDIDNKKKKSIKALESIKKDEERKQYELKKQFSENCQDCGTQTDFEMLQEFIRDRMGVRTVAGFNKIRDEKISQSIPIDNIEYKIKKPRISVIDEDYTYFELTGYFVGSFKYWLCDEFNREVLKISFEYKKKSTSNENLVRLYFLINGARRLQEFYYPLKVIGGNRRKKFSIIVHKRDNYIKFGNGSKYNFATTKNASIFQNLIDRIQKVKTDRINYNIRVYQ